MKKVDTLISTMHINNPSEARYLLKRMNVRNFTMVSQTNINNRQDSIENGTIFYCSHRGLSRSRNFAIDNSSAELCLLADDDMTYVDNYEQIIIEGFHKYPNADIIAFYVKNAKPKNAIAEGKINKRKSLKLCSVQIAFRRKSIISNQIRFDTDFGSGSKKYNSGEENIFLSDCLAKNCKIYYIPKKIGVLQESESTWFHGYDNSFFESKGACLKRIFKHGAFIYIILFALKKYPLYKKEATLLSAVKKMLTGSKNYAKKI